jgi:hypothetical protein
MSNMEETMFWEFGSEFVHRGNPGVFCSSGNTVTTVHLSGNPQEKNGKV